MLKEVDDGGCKSCQFPYLYVMKAKTNPTRERLLPRTTASETMPSSVRTWMLCWEALSNKWTRAEFQLSITLIESLLPLRLRKFGSNQNDIKWKSVSTRSALRTTDSLSEPQLNRNNSEKVIGNFLLFLFFLSLRLSISFSIKKKIRWPPKLFLLIRRIRRFVIRFGNWSVLRTFLI